MSERVIGSTLHTMSQQWASFLMFMGIDMDEGTFNEDGELIGVDLPHARMTNDTFKHKLRQIEYIGCVKPEDSNSRIEFYRFNGIRYQIAYLAFSWAITEAN